MIHLYLAYPYPLFATTVYPPETRELPSLSYHSRSVALNLVTHVPLKLFGINRVPIAISIDIFVQSF